MILVSLCFLTLFVRDRAVPQGNISQLSPTSKEEVGNPAQVLGVLDFLLGFVKCAITICSKSHSGNPSVELLKVAGVAGLFLRDLRCGCEARVLWQAWVADEIIHGKAFVCLPW